MTNESSNALEIVLDTGESYFTNDFDNLLELQSAIAAERMIHCWWVRSDNVRFEEMFLFNEGHIKMLRTNRS